MPPTIARVTQLMSAVVLLILVSGFATGEELRYAFVTAGKREGAQTITTDANRVSVDFQFNDRGRGPKLHEDITLDEAGLVRSYRVSGNAYLGSEVDERFDVSRGVARWTSQSDKGQQPVQGAYAYVPVNGTPAMSALIARLIVSRPDASLRAIPGGTLRARHVDSLVLQSPSGRMEVALYAVTGIGLEPDFVWLDGEKRFFAQWWGWSSLIREGWESAEKQLGELQEKASYGILEGMAARLRRKPAGLVAIRNVRVFDAPSGKTISPATVYVFRDRITHVDAANGEPGKEAEVIDGSGHTLLPGLVDMHSHEGPWASLLEIAGGVTSVRDLGNDNTLLQDLQDRITAGTAIGPRMWKAGIIDGRSPYSAPTGNIVSTLAEALRLVDWYAQRGSHRSRRPRTAMECA